MKIKPEHYQHIVDTFQRHAAENATQIEEYRKWLLAYYVDKPGDPEKRFRWDLFRACGLVGWQCKTLYTYLDDSHIDTALKSAVKELRI